MESDLGREAEDWEMNEHCEWRKEEIEKELFAKAVFKAFGKEEEDVYTKEFFKEYHVLYKDCNGALAAAERGDKYFIFHFGTS